MGTTAKTSVVRPTTEGWKPRDLIRDVLDLTGEAVGKGCCGPFVVVLSHAWRPYLKLPYRIVYRTGQEQRVASRKVKGDKPLRERLEQIEFITAVVTSDKLSGWEVALYDLCLGMA